MSIVCENCGFENPPGMRFCGNCGTRLVEVKSAPKPIRSPEHSPIDETRVDPARLGVMTGSDLMARFQQAGLEASGQRRNVTILFVDLSGYSHLSEMISDEALYELVHRFIRVLADDVYRYEGMVDKFTGDGLMALFGAPIAHENDAERAIRAAMDMQADVAQLSKDTQELHGIELRVHIGLHAGSVIVGGIGNDAIMNYTAIGDSVNLARRLEEAAEPGTILVSESVFRQTRRLFDYEALPPQRLKGIGREVRAYKLLKPKAQPGNLRGLDGLHAPMIGRADELKRLSQAVDRLIHKHQGGTVLLVGEAGMGKSRLTAELKASLNLSEVRILEGRSLTYRKSIAYWIFQDVLRSYLGVTPETPSGEVHLRLVDEVKLAFTPGSDWRERLPYLEYLLSIEPTGGSPASRLRYLDAGQLRQQIFLAVRDLFVSEARRKPLLLILEDLHWADESSLELIQFLLDTTLRVPLLIYAISRPFEGSAVTSIRERAQRRLASRFLDIQLQALPPDQSKQLLHALLALPDLPETLREGIIQRSAGSPFYLEEILRMLIENHILYREGEQWRLTPGADPGAIGVPETLQGLILTRFDRLLPAQRQVLQTASVIGYQFNTDVLAKVLSPLPEGELTSILNWLVEREFVQPDPGTFGKDLVFRHALVSDAVYSTLLQRDRRELHSRVAEAIETLHTNRLESQVEILANHYLRSSQIERALHYLILSGQKAARDFANNQARQHFEQALGLLDKVPHTAQQAFQIHMGLGDALVTAGDYHTAREHLQAALEMVLDPVDDDSIRQHSILQRKIATTYERQGDYEQALDRLLAAEAILRRSNTPFPVEQASILNDIGWVYSRRGSTDQAESFLIQALKLAEPTGQYDVIASILNRLGGICFQRDALEQAAVYLARSLELREKIGDVVNVARSFNNLGLLRWKQGDLTGALEYFHRSFRLQANLEDVEGLIELKNNMGLVEVDRGNMDQAAKHFHEALQSAMQIGHSYHIGLSNLHLAFLKVSQEAWQEALDHSRISLASFQEIGVQEHQLELHTFIGLAYLGLGRLAETEEAARVVTQTLTAGEGSVAGGLESEGRALRLTGAVARQNQDWEQACQDFKRSAETFAQVGNQLEQARSLVELADLLADRGQQDEARVYLLQAGAIFRSQGASQNLSKLAEVESKLTQG